MNTNASASTARRLPIVEYVPPHVSERVLLAVVATAMIAGLVLSFLN